MHTIFYSTCDCHLDVCVSVCVCVVYVNNFAYIHVCNWKYHIKQIWRVFKCSAERVQVSQFLNSVDVR